MTRRLSVLKLFGSVAFAVILVACRGVSNQSDGTTPWLGSALAPPNATGDAGFKTLYSFEGDPDGRFPKASLVAVTNVLYGTTSAGGEHAVGTLFKMSLAGDESVVHSFGRGDGIDPRANVIALNGDLYGTTYSEGPNLGGTVYDVTIASGKLEVLYGFNGKDGLRLESGLLAASNTLYGTTSEGGTGTKCSDGCGTVFALSLPSGKHRIVYSFKGGTDGSSPVAGLIAVRGMLYGTTRHGGATSCLYGCGTVFALAPSSGKERVIYRFKGGKDGNSPAASLLAFKGKLYGTTVAGGIATPHCTSGCGTVFAVRPVPHAAAEERIIHRFTGGKDGAAPYAALIEVRSVLYGTTAAGGLRDSCLGCGTVFQVDASGVERVLHTFNGRDGSHPQASLIEADGALYGTTEKGGEHCPFAGCGTVFTLSP